MQLEGDPAVSREPGPEDLRAAVREEHLRLAAVERPAHERGGAAAVVAHVHRGAPVRRHVRVRRALAARHAAAAAALEVDEPQVVVDAELADHLADRDEGLPRRAQRERAVRVHVRRAAEVRAVERDAPHAGPVVEALREVRDEAPVGREARALHEPAAAGEGSGRRHRARAHGGAPPLGPGALRGGVLVPQRRKLLAPERAPARGGGRPRPDGRALARDESGEALRAVARPEEAHEAAAEEVRDVPDGPVERGVHGVVERGERPVERERPRVHVEARAGVPARAGVVLRLVQDREPLDEEGRGEAVRDPQLAEDPVERGRHAAHAVEVEDVDVLVLNELAEPVAVVLQHRARGRRHRVEPQGVVGERRRGAVRVVHVVGEHDLRPARGRPAEDGREARARPLGLARDVLRERLLALVVVDAEVGRLDRAPAEGRVVGLRPRPRGPGERGGGGERAERGPHGFRLAAVRRRGRVAGTPGAATRRRRAAGAGGGRRAGGAARAARGARRGRVRGEEAADALLHERGVLERRDVGAARQHEQLAPGDRLVHGDREVHGGERVAHAGDDERRHPDVGEVSRGVVLGRRGEQAHEQGRVDARQVGEVGEEVLALHERPVHLEGERVVHGDVRRDERAKGGPRRRGPAVDDHARVGEHRAQHLRVVERVEEASRRAAEQHEPRHALGREAVGLEHHLHAHRVAGEHRALLAGGVEHGEEVPGAVGESGPLRIGGRVALAVAAVVPVQDAALPRERRGEPPPDVARAADAVGQQDGGRARAGARPGEACPVRRGGVAACAAHVGRTAPAVRKDRRSAGR